MRKQLLGFAAVSTMLTPIAAAAETEVQFWHAFTGRLGELVALPRGPNRPRMRTSPRQAAYYSPPQGSKVLV